MEGWGWRQEIRRQQLASVATVPVRDGSLQGVSRRNGKEEGQKDTGSLWNLPKASCFSHHPVFLLPGTCLLEGSHSDYTCQGGLSSSCSPSFEYISRAVYGFSWIQLCSLRSNLLEGFSSQVPPAFGGGGPGLEL